MNNAESAATALRALGGKLSPAHDRLWLIPHGTLRKARQIARENQYPAAFKIGRKVTAEMAKHGWKIAPDGKVYVGDRMMTVSAAREIVRQHKAAQAHADAHDGGSNEAWDPWLE